jgi:hypothetical protein
MAGVERGARRCLVQSQGQSLSDPAQIVVRGLLVHAAANLREMRWPQAAAKSALAVAFKPIVLTTLGVAFVL